MWGIEKESVAHEAFLTLLIEEGNFPNFQYSDYGFVISPEYPFLGASPDGVIVCGNDKFVIEIKCPYSHRYETVQQATMIDSNFPLCKDELNGELVVKKNHPYYFQMQLQMFVVRAKAAFLVIYTLKDIFKILVPFSSSFMEHNIPLARLFWEHCILPELFSGYFTNKKKKRFGID